ncbi:MAG: hypothetical protein QNJ09_02790 [Paracoccaceae bacterium]|nr:hypothetical protein [Paracoccaceae bacterium]
MSHYSNQVAVVVGADHPLGAFVAISLAQSDATVVAIGAQREPLMQLASAAPRKIEPLVLHPGRQDVFAVLQEAWAAEPIHIYIDVLSLTPLIPSEPASPTARRSAALLQALDSGLRAGQARVVMALATEADEDHPQPAEYEAMLQHWLQEPAPWRLTGVRMPGTVEYWTDPRCNSAGAFLLSLCDPEQPAMPRASVLDWTG